MALAIAYVTASGKRLNTSGTLDPEAVVSYFEPLFAFVDAELAAGHEILIYCCEYDDAQTLCCCSCSIPTIKSGGVHVWLLSLLRLQ